MVKEMRVGVALSILFVIGILVGVVTILVYRPYTPMGGMMQGDLEWYYTAKTLFANLNIVLLVALLVIYVNIYVKIRSEFALGLVIFSAVLLLYALTSDPMLHMIWGFHGYGLGPFAMFPDLFTTVALTVLLYLSLK